MFPKQLLLQGFWWFVSAAEWLHSVACPSAAPAGLCGQAVNWVIPTFTSLC